MSSDELASESYKTQKTREKLKKYLEKIDEQVTQAALDRKSREIHRWIARQAPNRLPLKKKDISLFDANQNPAKHSTRINSLYNKLQIQIDEKYHKSS
ncbi:MAG: hypothetical protein SP1CHLAM54_09870 [Chlamydiia bacterium]|nr:hypothetical protein [Chlamydiia bacterium]MCH9615893.1 hypothetical protein [Chlamydiia bacterium]MCH9628704.1 hypothetical protein [Chlamydiia bacterium]